MDINQRIELFQGMINCKYPLFCWEYDAQWNLLRSNCPEKDFYDMLLTRNEYMPMIQANMENNCQALLVGVDAGVLWGIVCDAGSGNFHVIGPVMSVECSRRELEELGQEIYQEVLRQIGKEEAVGFPRKIVDHLHSLPVVSIIEFRKDLAMLYYCVMLQELHTSEITYQIMQDRMYSEEAKPRDRYRTWMTEQTLLGMVRNGDINYKSALDQAAMVSQGVPLRGNTPLRQAKLSGQVFASLCTRAAMEGGLTPETAYTVGDAYIQQIEDCRNLSEIPHITHAMYEEFINRVHDRAKNPKISGKIQNCMDYMEHHLHEKLTVTELAARAGYSESALSHKFKEETGRSVSAYLKEIRVARARFLLETTEDSVQEIAVKTGFCGRSHLARAFQELVGQGPLECRESYRKSKTRGK